MWAGKLGLGAHQRSPSPEDMSFLLGQAKNGHGTLSTSQMKKLDSDADEFRRRRAGKEEGKRVEGMQWKARALLKEFDEAKGMKVRPCRLRYLFVHVYRYTAVVLILAPNTFFSPGRRSSIHYGPSLPHRKQQSHVHSSALSTH